MAYSYVLYAGDGSNKYFSFHFSYLDKTHVKAKIDNTPTTAFTWLTNNSIQFTTAPAAGIVIEIYRETPQNTAPVDFTDGSVLLERDLDLLTIFNLYVGQEATDRASRAISVGSDGAFNALGLRVSNAADPINDQDLVTKKWAETSVSTSVGQALSAKDTAVSARDTAVSASNTAVTKATEAANSAASALDSKNWAATFSNTAINAKTQAVYARNDAQAKAAEAATSATSANDSAALAAKKAAEAAASAVDASNTLKDFKGQWLGPLADDPTVDSNGNPVAAGDLYFSTTLKSLKVFNGVSWRPIGGAGVTGAGGDSVFFENDNLVRNSYTITTGKNAMSAGPIAINNGVTVTVPNGSVWTVV